MEGTEIPSSPLFQVVLSLIAGPTLGVSYLCPVTLLDKPLIFSLLKIYLLKNV